MPMSRLSQLEVINATVGMHADGSGLYLTRGGQLNKAGSFATASDAANARWDWARSPRSGLQMRGKKLLNADSSASRE
jgi:hypothetical protein